ncbi:zinc finger, CCHC-type containing protein [Tanacetum coccineum]
MGNNTWVLDDLPSGCKPLGCKWIFKRKMKIDGTIENFKVRPVIQGFRQKSGINYFDTYALVTRISTIRLLITLALIHNLIIHQMDVKTTFLNGELDEEQAPNKFDETGKGVSICLYVDDMLIFGTDQVQVDITNEFLSSKFSMKNMGEADVILGIRIKHESNRISISQSHYSEKVLKKFNYIDCTPVSTPMDTSEKLMRNNGQAVSQLKYSRVIGCLMYAMTCTRPDIALQLISNTKDNSYISGWVFLLDEGAISWASKKQTCITSSTMESKIIALEAAVKEAEYAATLAKAYSQMYNGKSRHLGVRHNMIHELIMNGVVSIEFVRSQQNIVDHLKKGLTRDLVLKSAEGMNLKSN